MGEPRNSALAEDGSSDTTWSFGSESPARAGDSSGSENPETSFWDHKARWCQPWSIVGSGVLIIGLSWWLVKRWWISVPLSLAIGVWWWLFLVAVPTAWRTQRDADIRAILPESEPADPGTGQRDQGDRSDLHNHQS